MRKLINRRSIVLLTLILAVSGSKAASTGPLELIVGPPAPDPPAGTVRLLTWNVAHGRADAFHQALLGRAEVERNLAAIADVLRHERPDVVALQEADGPSAWSGNFDHVSTLAGSSGFGHHYRGDHNPFGLSSYSLSSGTALVSRLPLVEPRSEPFGANWRDTKGFVVATVEIPGTGRELDVVSVHLDFLNPAGRREQILALAEVLEGRDRPRVILGDLNFEAGSARGGFALLAERLGVVPYEPTLDLPTYPASGPTRRLDWILASPELEFVSYRAIEAGLSDHLGVVAELRLAG